MKDGLVRWTGLVSAAAFAAWANLGAFGPGGWATIVIGAVAVAAWWLFAFAVIRADFRASRQKTF
jgi:hypothetical protein